MLIINDFINSRGMEVYETIQEYIINNKLADEFDSLKTNYDKLFEFAIKYGILEIVKYLYEDKNIIYNMKIITSFDTKITTQDLAPDSVPISNGNGNSGLNMQLWDKFSIKRNECIKYLFDMRKKSVLINNNGQFFYKLNTKYLK